MIDEDQQCIAIEVKDLVKVYRGGIRAVDGISFTVKKGEIFGLLGPNGAGKTTTIRIIATLTVQTSGHVLVFGKDTLRNQQEVRQMIGYVPQAISVDGNLTAYENLLIFSKLFNVNKKDRDVRISEALELMGLSSRANDLVKNYSGGMMRRLELAQAIVNRPSLLILDEPTIGLDPTSRVQIWNIIKKLNSELGMTVLLTTHDMTEADYLCNRVAIINSGRISIIGAPEELKRTVGYETIRLTFTTPLTGVTLHHFISPGSSIPEVGLVESIDGTTIKIQSQNAERSLTRAIEYFEKMGLKIDTVSISRPSLDDVFMKYARVRLNQEGSISEIRAIRRTFARRER